MKKSNIFVILFIIILIIFIFFFSLYFFNLFDSKNPTLISSLNVTLNDEQTDHPASRIGDDEDNSTYSFVVTNNSKMGAKYQVLLYDRDATISRKNVHYKLQLNDATIKTGTLDEVKDNVLDSRTVNGKSTNSYLFTIWVSEDDNLDSDDYYDYYLKLVPTK